MIVLVIYLQFRYEFITSLLPVGREEQERMHEEAILKLRQEMMEGADNIEITYQGSAGNLKDFATTLMDEVFLVDDEDTSDDFDYLHYKFTAADIRMRGMGNKFTITYNLTYLEDNEQTNEVNRKTEEILKEMKLKNKSEYKKVKLIHDFIISNSEYDRSAQYNSAYGCLIKHYSACQGYAHLAYKMLTKAGIPCRIVTGISSGEPHAWNIVKVDGKWYLMDCTWDDPMGAYIPKSANYAYFLKGKMNFKDHELDSEFTTKEFEMEYPIENTDYKR